MCWIWASLLSTCLKHGLNIPYLYRHLACRRLLKNLPIIWRHRCNFAVMYWLLAACCAMNYPTMDAVVSLVSRTLSSSILIYIFIICLPIGGATQQKPNFAHGC